jgi:acyl-CoA synthetase (AMP-forming)/AMP-acid ligase II
VTRLAEAIADNALRRPDAVAIDSGARRIRWDELGQMLPVLVAELVSVWPGRDSPAVVALDHGLANCLLDLAFAEAGIPVVQVPPFFTAGQLAHAAAAAGAAAFIRAGPGRTPFERRLGIAIERRSGDPVPLPDGTAKISFTSGSTALPKGICLSIGHLTAVAGAVVGAVGAEQAGRHLPVLQPGILLETVAGFYASILAGGTHVALSQEEIGLASPFRPQLPRLVRAMAGHEVSSLILVPEYLGALVAALEASGARLPGLSLVAVGGARIAPGLLDRAARLGLPVRQGYGLTECGSVVALERAGEPIRGSVGSSLGLNPISLADDGEILVDGPLCLGAVGGAPPASPLRTGDLGRYDAAGRLWIEGRKSNLIVTAFGRNVSPEWVETLLLDQPAIAQAMVRGDGAAELDALIVPAAAGADVGAAVAAANAGLPAYARIGAWRSVPPFTAAGGLLTGNGRLRRAAIDQAYPREPASMNFFERIVAETSEAQAVFAATPQLRAGLAGEIGRSDYLAYLAQAYHHVRHTVPLMMEARARLGHRPALVEALDAYIAEETGHEAWILADIDAAGGCSSAVARSAPAPATEAMVRHAYDRIRNGNPVALFGMIYVLEGTSIAMATQGAEAVRAKLGLPAEAFRYLTSHGALDQEHMRFFERLMDCIDDPDDRQAILDMAGDMFRLFGAVFGSIALEADLAAA